MHSCTHSGFGPDQCIYMGNSNFFFCPTIMSFRLAFKYFTCSFAANSINYWYHLKHINHVSCLLCCLLKKGSPTFPSIISVLTVLSFSMKSSKISLILLSNFGFQTCRNLVTSVDMIFRIFKFLF